jgi:hypothetical protein
MCGNCSFYGETAIMEAIMGHILRAAFAATIATVATGALTVTAEAKRDGYSEAYRYVTAYATIGGQTVTAPVREGRFGDQVQTPGGNWYDCEITCEYTLRRLTVDFWEGQQDGGFVSPGYLRYDFDLDTQTVHRRPFIRSQRY